MFYEIAGSDRIRWVDAAIFTERYHSDCARCGICDDRCCRYGVDVDAGRKREILRHRAGLEPLVGVPAEQWFENIETPDPDFESGACDRTRAAGDGCVFLRREGRGCLLHVYADRSGLDYRRLKPMVSSLFPVSFGDGVLQVSDDFDDLPCAVRDPGPAHPGVASRTLYEGVRDDIAHYFGPAIAARMDSLQEIRRGPRDSEADVVKLAVARPIDCPAERPAAGTDSAPGDGIVAAGAELPTRPVSLEGFPELWESAAAGIAARLRLEKPALLRFKGRPIPHPIEVFFQAAAVECVRFERGPDGRTVVRADVTAPRIRTPEGRPGSIAETEVLECYDRALEEWPLSRRQR